MATLVLLWGNNVHNKSRIQEVNKELLPFYASTHIHNYRHWNTEWWDMNLDYECEQLCNYLKTLWGSIILFCKSIWCILGLKAMVEQEIFIKQCIFVWFPLGYTKLHNDLPIEKYLKELTCPVLRIQKTDDPAGSYAAITKQLWALSPAFTCKEIPGDDHSYKEINILKQYILDNNAR
ncbi:MAG: hypothetical protein ACD_80C00011G0017 [uncultured bacterium (gcode 4)]|uniref:Uncharacterized protein n=1 Tax=uncultured bacterium (gcode 4) TaxID=1234023 RepID=K1X5X6_9BACT|nr:MAG: hypothetical protein ACD_80C00011G0017 [uncultured bacterium (gcode 4)]